VIKLEPLRNALQTLTQALAEIKLNPNNLLMRDGVIQRFEYCYELAWKTLERYLKQEMGVTNSENLSKRDLYRIAAEKGLLINPQNWYQYHEARNLSAHAYKQEYAERVFAVTVDFLNDANALLTNLAK
jgi:nucleotidyltransferase substrate binding protein (TIGR01987 family)